jgi:hypothetical protein
VLAVACLGVLKLNSLHEEKDHARERPATASFLPIIDTKTGANSLPAEGIAKLGLLNRWMGAVPGSNHVNSAAMDQLKNGKGR